MANQNRVFTEEEIGRVLKRAATLQGKQGPRSGPGLSLAELQELAAETGLDPSLVEVAALELDADREASTSNWWGGPLSATLVRSVEGEISDETWEEMLSVVRRHFKTTGVTERRGTTRQWMLPGKEGSGHLIATYRDGRTQLELFWSQGAMAIPFYIIPLIGAIIMLPIIFEALSLNGVQGFLVWWAGFSALLVGARTLVSRSGRNEKRELREVVDEIARLGAHAAAVHPRTPSRTVAAEPQIEIPDPVHGSATGGQDGRRDRSRT